MFEQIPDTAFFGKNMGRFCNRFYCYFWLLFLKGIIGIAILSPVLVIVISMINFVLATTSFFWFPAVLFGRSMIEWLFFDIDCEPLRQKYGVQVVLPLVAMHLRLVFFGFWQASLALAYSFGILPVVIVIWFFLAVMRYLLRSLYDCIMYVIVCCFARVPIRENNIAWRIKGPGVGHVRQYKKIENDDVFILMQAELEKIELSVFEDRISKKLQKPLDDAQKVYDQILSGF